METEETESKVDLARYARSLVLELRSLDWGRTTAEKILYQIVRRHDEEIEAALVAKLRPRVSLEKLEEIARRIGDLHFGLMPERYRVIRVLREELWGNEPAIWSSATPYPDDWVDPKLSVPRDKDNVWLLLRGRIVPQALGARIDGRWSSVETRGGCWLEDDQVLGWCALKQSSKEGWEETDG